MNTRSRRWARPLETKPALTRRQQQVLDYMRSHPGFSYREAMDDLGFASTNSVTEYVRLFEELGLIEKRPGARGIRVVDGDPVAELVHAASDALGVEVSNPNDIARVQRLARALEPFGGVGT